LTDDELIADVGRGNRDSLDQLIERHYRDVYRFVCHRTMDPDEARDITQDVFVEVVGLLPRYREGNFKGCLYTVARHACLDFFRKRKRTTGRWDPVDALELLPAGGPDPEESLERKREGEEAVRLLAGLPARQREVLVLRFYYQLELKEIGGALGIPLSKVKSRLYSGLDRLKKELIRNEEG